MSIATNSVEELQAEIDKLRAELAAYQSVRKLYLVTNNTPVGYGWHVVSEGVYNQYAEEMRMVVLGAYSTEGENRMNDIIEPFMEEATNLRRLVKEYFEAIDDKSLLVMDIMKYEQELRAAIGEN